MIQKFQKALAPVAAAFGAAAIALTPANDVNAQTTQLRPAADRAAAAAPSFAIGRSVSVADFPAMAERLGQASVARMEFIYEGRNGQPNTAKAVYVTVNTETGRGWIFQGDGPHGKVTRVSPIYEIQDVVMFKHEVPGAGIERLIRSSPMQSAAQARSDCQRWQETLVTESCVHKNAYYNGLMEMNAAVAMVGYVVNGNPADANIFTIAHYTNRNAGSFGLMGRNAYIDQAILGNFHAFPIVQQSFTSDHDAVGFITPQQQAALNR